MAVGNERLLGQHMTTKLRPDECRHETRFRAAISHKKNGEISEEARTLLCYAADATAARTWVADGATSEEHAAALLKNRLYRRWGIKTAREYARIKIDGLRLVGGNPDFTNAPGHGDDDARFYDRQQAYVHARGG